MNERLNFDMLAPLYEPRNVLSRSAEQNVATSSVTLYGIKNCDTVKKARKWLEQHNIEYRFHDFRGDGLDRVQVSAWVEELGWENLLNRRSTTWKQLDPDVRNNIDSVSAIDAMTAHPTLIKRPLLEQGNTVQTGFRPEIYQQLFG